MALNIELDNPELNIRKERSTVDAGVRTLGSIKQYAHLNKFDGALDAIIKKYGGKQRGSTGAEVQRILRVAKAKLRQPIDAARKGKALKPITQPLVYRFTGSDGRTMRFKLDPAEVVNHTLRQFERIVSSMPNGDKIEAQFMPTFRALRLEMLKLGWDADGIGPQATLLAIQQLCDRWSVGRI